MVAVWWRIQSIHHRRQQPDRVARTGTTRSSISLHRQHPAQRTFVMSLTRIIRANRTAITVMGEPQSILPVRRPPACNMATIVSRIRRRRHHAPITTAMCALCRNPPARHRRHRGAPRTSRRSRLRHHQYSRQVGDLRNILRVTCKLRGGATYHFFAKLFVL